MYFAENIDCGYSLELPQRGGSKKKVTNAHNLCFEAKIKKYINIHYNPVTQVELFGKKSVLKVIEILQLLS